jgi:hypothetical protein
MAQPKAKTQAIVMQEVVHVALKLMCGTNRRSHAKIILRATNNMEKIA